MFINLRPLLLSSYQFKIVKFQYILVHISEKYLSLEYRNGEFTTTDRDCDILGTTETDYYFLPFAGKMGNGG